jgi:4-hydroxy-tetrahydrodipicolinate reductase
MKIALIGYGKMGKAIEKIAVGRGHEVVAVIDVDNRGELQSEAFRSADAAIEFTTPQTAVDNYYACFSAGVPVVSGTTGWLTRLDEVKEACLNGNHAMFYASNFSVGVNIFFALNRKLAHIMNSFPDYSVRMKEIHHIHKLDAPSGTAITLAEGILSEVGRLKTWQLAADSVTSNVLPIEAVREGEVPGTHEIEYESGVDSIVIRHEAKSREGFALGAVLAAEFIAGRRGFLGMEDMLEL